MVLNELDIDVSGQRSKGLDAIELDTVDAVIALCVDEVCPFFPRPVSRLTPGPTGPTVPPSHFLSTSEQKADSLDFRRHWQAPASTEVLDSPLLCAVARDSSTGNLCFESASVALRPRIPRLQWGLPDPAAQLEKEARLQAFRTVRDELHKRLKALFNGFERP
jgi:protein-tyrosine-phosphatase